MSIVNSILKVIGLEKTNLAVAKEINVADPDENKVADILAANEIPQKPIPPKTHKIREGF